MAALLLYPSDPLDPRRADDQWIPEIGAARAGGMEVALFSVERMRAGRAPLFPRPAAGSDILYRGWMLDEGGYRGLCAAVAAAHCRMVVSPDAYLCCHHLPRWYPAIQGLTIETRVFPADCDITAALRGLRWPGYFLKDYVKSLKTKPGSACRLPSEAPAIISAMRRCRGTIEGGLCVRRLVEMAPGDEIRCFVAGGAALAPAGEPPPIVLEVARRIDSPFFSVDVARLSDGARIVIDLGDGQVSEPTDWDLARFVAVLERVAAGPPAPG